ncbi:hypothetical protein BDZ85DRAFT_69746 [Elsinoe ampelina]|uniref:Uncharacterized protein n=1 Tax=Elsinoe ampelina TaxID=302913 RepID=A0A6A6GIV8_9PEZI|nr:hypothetical protein BDZ85DRAFT_69746 [Elsinoe ampelina]
MEGQLQSNLARLTISISVKFASSITWPDVTFYVAETHDCNIDDWWSDSLSLIGPIRGFLLVDVSLSESFSLLSLLLAAHGRRGKDRHPRFERRVWAATILESGPPLLHHVARPNHDPRPVHVMDLRIEGPGATASVSPIFFGLASQFRPERFHSSLPPCHADERDCRYKLAHGACQLLQILT